MTHGVDQIAHVSQSTAAATEEESASIEEVTASQRVAQFKL